MFYTDKIYGQFEIGEPVLIELINSPSLQRLKDIDQQGYRGKHFPGNPCSRFEHSLGVFLLLRKYGAQLEEQIAGLIHDVSHSAFSHIIDYVLAKGTEKEQSHQDDVFEEYVLKSEIPQIIKKYGLNLEYILNDANFPLKENSLPDICADRIDYCLRDGINLNEATPDDIKYFLENLIVKKNQWMFKNPEAAKKFALLFSELNAKYYSGFVSATMFVTVANYLKYALEKKYINEPDLYTTDKIVLKKIAPYLPQDAKLQYFFNLMNDGRIITNNPQNYQQSFFCKSRAIDPLLEKEGQIKKLSEIWPEWQERLKIESVPKEYFIQF
ncbi:MAG: HD domain-containing protein [Candidatus Magasanikbacteria bacterium]|nr:HD domain-containing protein [Candidatus Magasanikbacteria bacterium]